MPVAEGLVSVFMRVKLVRSDYRCGLQCFARKC
jgi:hypothetical protein